MIFHLGHPLCTVYTVCHAILDEIHEIVRADVRYMFYTLHMAEWKETALLMFKEYSTNKQSVHSFDLFATSQPFFATNEIYANENVMSFSEESIIDR